MGNTVLHILLGDIDEMMCLLIPGQLGLDDQIVL